MGKSDFGKRTPSYKVLPTHMRSMKFTDLIDFRSALSLICKVIQLRPIPNHGLSKLVKSKSGLVGMGTDG